MRSCIVWLQRTVVMIFLGFVVTSHSKSRKTVADIISENWRSYYKSIRSRSYTTIYSTSCCQISINQSINQISIAIVVRWWWREDGFTYIHRIWVYSLSWFVRTVWFLQRPSWPWPHGSSIYSYICNACLSPPKLWVWTPFMARCTRYNIMW